jgi:CTP synthase (UTP-ammonia lyase)
MAAIIGSAGMFRLNREAWNYPLALREGQRSERLMSIAYQLDDGVIEGLESKEHSWVIGVQFMPERADEVPASFNSLFLGLVERAEVFTATGDNRI